MRQGNQVDLASGLGSGETVVAVRMPRRWASRAWHPALFTALFAACGLVGLANAEEGKKEEEGRSTVVMVVGAEGTQEYGKLFREWAGKWKKAAEKGGAKWVEVGLDEEGKGGEDREKLEQALKGEEKQRSQTLWLVLVGHGTFDRRAARFNLRGTDVSAEEVAGWLKEVQRPTAVVNCASTSGAWLPVLSAENRVVLTATRAGAEQNFARLGGFLAEAVADPAADLDKDGQTSLFEAYLDASRKVQAFYKDAGRLATEHALLDDDGDQKGSPAEWFEGLSAVKRPAAGRVDGTTAHQFHLLPSLTEQALAGEPRLRRNGLERELVALKDQKGEWDEAEYFAELERLLVELAELYEAAEAEAAETKTEDLKGAGSETTTP